MAHMKSHSQPATTDRLSGCQGEKDERPRARAADDYEWWPFKNSRQIWKKTCKFPCFSLEIKFLLKEHPFKSLRPLATLKS